MNLANFFLGTGPATAPTHLAESCTRASPLLASPLFFYCFCCPIKARAAGPLFAHRNGALRRPVEGGGEDEAVRQGIGT